MKTAPDTALTAENRTRREWRSRAERRSGTGRRGGGREEFVEEEEEEEEEEENRIREEDLR